MDTINTSIQKNPEEILDKYNMETKESIDKEIIELFLHLPIDDSYEQKMRTLLNKYPLMDMIKLILQDEIFINNADIIQIERLNNLMDFLNMIDEKTIETEGSLINKPDEITIGNLTNNQTRKQLAFDYSKEKKIPETWLNVKHFIRKPVVIISNDEKTGDIIYEELEKIIEIESVDNLNFRIEDIKPTRYAVVIKLYDVSDVKKIIEFIQKKKPTWKTKIPELSFPLMLMKKVKIDPKKQTEWFEKIMKKNKFKYDANTKIISTIKKGQNYNLVIQVTPEIRSQIQDRYGVIFGLTQRIEVIDYFNIPICTKCVKPGHKDDQCFKHIRKCAYGCQISHEWQEACPKANDKGKQRCPNCFKQGHSAFDKNCPKWQEKLEVEISKRNYPYEWIIM